MPDLETCSWCLTEVEWAELDKPENEMKDGALICDVCRDFESH